MKLARDMNVPLLFTLDSHFVSPNKKFLQDILLKQDGKTGWHFNTVYSQYSLEESWQMWKRRHPHLADMARNFSEAVESNSELVSRIEPISFEKTYHLPPVNLPHEISCADQTEDEKMESYVFELIAQNGRFPSPGDPKRSEYVSRLRTELNVICRNNKVNFLPYFISLHDACKEARENGVLMSPGRGSAAGSLLSYLLKITHLDPIFWGLSFARFLSAGRINRGKLPDIDLDFGDPKIIADSLKNTYQDRFARISTTNTLKPKNAIRDVCRVLLNTQEDEDASMLVDTVCKSLSNPPQGMSDMHKWLYGWEDGEGAHPGEVDGNKVLQRFFDDHPQVKDGVDAILGIPRSLGRHASAYCLAETPLSEHMPMCTIKDEVCIQYTMGPVEELGFVKMDFLGLNTLKDIAGCLNHIKSRRGIDIDIYNIPDGDKDVFDNFCKGSNETVFQFNTSIGVDLCKKIKPRCIKDLSDITAAGRPGTMYALMDDGVTTLIDEWVQRRSGKRVSYVHPQMEEALRPTLGICIYQESLMRLFQDCCGFSEERADEIREIVGKKKKDQIDAILPEIRSILAERNWTSPQIESFISLIQAAGSYAFNRSHSLAYAYLGYVCQWLKTHYPLEWWTSVLQNSSMDDLKINAAFCKDLVVSPNINESHLDFYIIDTGDKIVFPLGMIRGVKKAAYEIVSKRPFESIDDFYNRVNRSVVHKGTVAALIWSGAFDELHSVETPTDRNGIYMRYLELRADKKEIDSFIPVQPFQALLNQNQALPLNSADFSTPVAEQLRTNSIIGLSRIESVKLNKVVRVVGCVSEIRQIKSKKCDEMAFIEIVDQSQTLSITIFPKTWSACKDKIAEGKIVFVEGCMQEYNGKKGFVAKSDIKVYGEVNREISTDTVPQEEERS